MPISHPNGTVYYRMHEALAAAGLSRSTYVRWVEQGKIRDTAQRDRNNARLFTVEELERLKALSFKVLEEQPQVLKFEAR